MASRPRLWILLLLIASIVLGAPAFADEPRAIPGELLIKFKSTAKADARASLKERMGATTLKRWDFIGGVEHVKLPHSKTVEQAITEFKADPSIEYIEPNWEIKLDAIPNDAMFPQLWGMRNTGQFPGGIPGADIHATNAWDVFTGNPNTLIGVIDTGWDYTHPDLAANSFVNTIEQAGVPGVDDDGNGYIDDIRGYDFVNNDGDAMDDNDHGTHCSGTIGGVGNNGIGVTGVNWNIKIVGIKFLSAGGTGSTAAAISSVQYAIAIGCQLTSNSWGGGGFSQALLDAINAAGAAGQLFIAAAGNSRSNNDVTPHYPSSYDTPYIIAVGATEHDDTIADEPTWGSSFGATSVDIGAPGVNIISSIAGGGYASFGGTSMATPHVAGTAALAFGRFPGITNMQVKNLIMTFADPVPALAGRWVTGGRLNAFMVIADPDETPPGAVDDLAISDEGSNHIGLSWTATGDDGETGTASNYDVRYSTSPIDAGNFDAAEPVTGPDPQPSGSPESFEVGGLTSNTFYYFAIKALDEYGNPGPISNVVYGATLGAPGIATNPTSFDESLLPGASVSRNLAISNIEAGNLDWSIPTVEFLLGGANTPKPFLEVEKGGIDPRPGEPALDASGGPDAFGYRWIDSNSPGGPVFSWVDITGVGTAVPFNGDDQYVNVTLPFPFEFYGGTFNSVRLATNGFASFSSAGATPPFTNQPLPNTGGEPNMVCPFWDDLDFRNFGDAYTYYDGNRFIISYISVPPYSTTPATPPPDRFTFQMILYPSGEIRYQYQSMTPPASSATVGIQDASETIGLQVVFNANYVQDGLAVKILPLVEWMTVSPTSGRVLSSQTQDVTVNFDATGLEGGDYHAIVHVLSNDPANPHLQLPATLHVAGGVSDINVDPTALDFGTFFVGGSPTRQFLVSNAGSSDLHVTSIASSDPSLTTDVSAFTVTGGNSQTVTATWAPGSPYTLNATLTVNSDDPDESSVVVTAVGNSVIAPDIAVTPGSINSALATTLGPTALSETKELAIHNEGLSDLTWTASATINGVTAAPAHTDETSDKEASAGPPGPPVTDASGGPDAAGYRWIDSNEPGGPAFGWVDISGIGTPIAFTGDDQNLGPIALPFPFEFYGTTFNSIRACTNGWLSFTATATTFLNTALPNTGTGAPKNLIAAFWEDLDFRPATSPTSRAYHYYDGEKFIISYHDVPHYPPTGAGTYTFQVFLYPNGRIDVQYLNMIGLLNSNTVGIQNSTGAIGLQVVFDQAYVQNNLRVSFRQRPEWFTIAPTAGTTPAGQTSIVTVSLNATDLEDGDYTGNINVSSNDPNEGSIDVPVALHVGVASASFTIDPNAVSSNDTHQWINTLITPPGGFDEHDILGSSLLIDQTVPSDPSAPVSYPPGVASHGFSRLALLSHLEDGRAIPIQLMGEVEDQTWFTADATIRVLKPVLITSLPGPYNAGAEVGLSWQDPSDTSPTHYELWYSNDGGHHWALVAGGLTGHSYILEVPNESTDHGVLELVAYDSEGFVGAAFTSEFRVIGAVTGIGDGSVPEHFGMRFASAVPSRGETRLELAVPRAGEVTVSVMDLRGARVQQVARGAFEPGRHTVRWNGLDDTGRPVSPGVYFIQASYGSETSNLRFAVIR